MNNWILLMVIDAFVISFSEVFKKKALTKNSIYEIPAFFTLIAFFNPLASEVYLNKKR